MQPFSKVLVPMLKRNGDTVALKKTVFLLVPYTEDEPAFATYSGIQVDQLPDFASPLAFQGQVSDPSADRLLRLFRFEKYHAEDG